MNPGGEQKNKIFFCTQKYNIFLNMKASDEIIL